MRIGIWSQYIKELPPEAAVRTLSAKGWTALELSSEHSEQLLQRGDPATVGRQFRAFAADEGAAIQQGHLWLEADAAGEDQATVVDTLKRWLDLYVAARIGAAVIHAGGGALKEAGADPRTVLERRVWAFRKLVHHLDGSDTSLCIENTSSAPGIDEILELITAVQSSYMAVCFDTGHATIHRVDAVDFIERSGPRLKALHIHDNDGQSDQHLMPFDGGTVPWSDVLRALNRVNYTGLFCYEVPGETGCPMESRLAKLDKLKASVPGSPVPRDPGP